MRGNRKTACNYGEKVTYKHKKFQELQRTETRITEDELFAELMKKVYLYEQNFLSDCTILENEVVQETTEDKIILTVNYKLEGDIGAEREIMAK